MTEPVADLPDPVAMAAALRIPLRPEWHATVRHELATSLRMADLVCALPLEDEVEFGPVFHP